VWPLFQLGHGEAKAAIQTLPELLFHDTMTIHALVSNTKPSNRSKLSSSFSQASRRTQCLAQFAPDACFDSI
jgi:hypothetical protein